jgi:GTP-binding protein
VIIRSVDFTGSVARPGQALPRDLPQIAFSGRSNVGKSSLINVLLRRTRKKLARVSSTPGKTQNLNFFRVNDRFYLVDLPGYGYARAPGDVREAWRRLVEDYFFRGEELRGVVHLVDGRHPPTKLDLEMMGYLEVLALPALVILTKMDKVSRSRREKTMNVAVEALGVAREQILPFSAKTGEGREALLAALDQLLTESPREEP